MELNPTTLVFETVNFVVLVILLWRLLYRPLRKAVERREAELAERHEEVRQTEHAAETLQQEWQTRTSELDEEANRVRTKIEESASAQRERIMAEARKDAAAERAKARALLAREIAAAERRMRELAIGTSAELAGQLLLELAPEALESGLVRGLEAAIRSSFAAVDLASPQVERVLDIRAAKLPTERAVDGLRELGEELIGGSVEVSVEEDQALVAGLVVRLGGRVFDASLAGHMEALTTLAGTLEPAVEPHAGG